MFPHFRYSHISYSVFQFSVFYSNPFSYSVFQSFRTLVNPSPPHLPNSNRCRRRWLRTGRSVYNLEPAAAWDVASGLEASWWKLASAAPLCENLRLTRESENSESRMEYSSVNQWTGLLCIWTFEFVGIDRKSNGNAKPFMPTTTPLTTAVWAHAPDGAARLRRNSTWPQRGMSH